MADDRERANKPSSVPAAPGRIISLGSALLRTSSSLPGTRSERAAPRPCLALLRVGFAVRLPLPEARCALTAPFHPCLCTPSGGHRRSVLCGTFHRLTPPGGYPAPCPAELGLSSDEGCCPPPAILTRTFPNRIGVEGRVYGRKRAGSIDRDTAARVPIGRHAQGTKGRRASPARRGKRAPPR